MYYRGASAAVVVFDVTSRESFEVSREDEEPLYANSGVHGGRQTVGFMEGGRVSLRQSVHVMSFVAMKSLD